MDVINCKQCGKPKERTSQNTDHQYCDPVCYRLWQSENKSKETEYTRRIPTGKFPMFV